MREKPPSPEEVKRQADRAEDRSADEEAKDQSGIAPEEFLRAISEQESYLERTSQRLANSVERLDRIGVAEAGKDLEKILDKIERKYRGTVDWLNTAGVIIGSGVLSFALQLDPTNMTMAENIDWGDLAHKEGKVIAVYALARLAALALKWKREATVGKTVIEKLNDE